MAHAVSFHDFTLDPHAGTLLRHGEPVVVRKKLWDALCLLVERRGNLVATEDLCHAVWRGIQVSDGSVANLIYELRRALGDRAAQPTCIETISGRGFRFIAEVRDATTTDADPDFVGRADEMGRLVDAWSRAAAGERQLVLVSGEAGIGKTKVIHRFLQWASTRQPAPRVLIGRCHSRRGAAAYLPVFDILDAWRETEGSASESSLRAILCRQAPRWARQIPWAAGDDVASPLSAMEARPDRMLREIAAVFEAGAAERPLILVFEDLHWADRATVDMLHYLTTRSVPARLMLVGSYRHAEAHVGEHPAVDLRQLPHERLTLLDLAPLNPDEVRQTLTHCFAGSPAVVDALLDETLRLSGGNPLYVQALARLLVDQEIVEQRSDGWQVHAIERLHDLGKAPEIAAVVQQQLALLPAAARELLEAAAVAGEAFDAAAVAGALEREVESVDAELRQLTLHASLVHEIGASSWPDETTSGRFRFRHALYRESLLRSLPSAHRARLHRRLGETLERGFAAAPQSVVASLAEHFSAGGDHARAVDYLERAALQMIARSALGEAAAYFRRALERVVLLPESDQRWNLEVRVRTGVGLSVALAEGLDAPDVRASYDAVDRLRYRIVDPNILFPTLRVFWVFELMRFGYGTMVDLSRQLSAVAAASGNAAQRSLAASMAGTTACFQGDLRRAREKLEESLQLCDDPYQLPPASAWLVDPRVESRCVLAWVLCLMGQPRQSRARLEEAHRLADTGRHESTRGLVLWFRSSLAQLDHDLAGTRAAADALEALAVETSIPAWLQIATIVRALARLTEGDPTALEHGLASLAGGDGDPTILIARAYLLGQLARAYGPRGEAAQGLALVDTALSHIRGNSARVSEADLLRIRGELLEAAGDPVAADHAYVEAMRVAHDQGARLFELRAATARVRLHRRQRNRTRREAAGPRERDLHAICQSLGDDADCHDVRIARALLDRAGE